MNRDNAPFCMFFTFIVLLQFPWYTLSAIIVLAPVTIRWTCFIELGLLFGLAFSFHIHRFYLSDITSLEWTAQIVFLVCVFSLDNIL